MTNPQQLEVLDLRHFNARQLRPLLNEEAATWQRRLRWDYRTSTDLLLDYLDNRILPGYVALARGKIVGYTFCVYEASKAVIGDLYVASATPAPLEVAATLTRHILETLNHSPDVDRIEAQLLLFSGNALPPLFPGFKVFPRLFLEKELTRSSQALHLVAPTHFPADIELRRWQPSFYNPTAELIQAAYLGHVDSEINDQYRTLAGSLRFLHNVIRFPGCGTFDPDSSFALRDHTTGILAAVLLCSRVALDTAHITQLCVAPHQRGRALGRMLLRHALDHLPTRSYRALTLTVTEANFPALHLYTAAGFRHRHHFDALVHDKPPRRPPNLTPTL